MADNQPVPHRCWICGEEVSLHASKTDENGHMVHERCYTLRVQLEGAPSPASKIRGPVTRT